MNSYLTRKGTPEEAKKLEAKNREELQKRIAKKRAEYGLPPQPVKVADSISKNLINANHTYDNGPFVVDHSTNELMTNQEYELREKKPNYPTEASEQQIQTLKKKLDKYRYIHGEDKKPFNKPKKKSAVLSVPSIPVAKDPIQPPPTKTPEKPLEQIIAERSAERLKREQENFDQQFGTQGIVKLLRPL